MPAFRQYLTGALAGAAWLAASGAEAQHEPPRVQMKPPPVEGTVVAPLEVEAIDPAALKKQTASFVETFGATTPRLDQYARWLKPVCVTVQGLAADQSAQVKTRVEDVAKALGLRALGSGCDANLEIKFADQPQGFLDRVAATHEDLLGYWHRRDRNSLKTMTHPIQAWYQTATIGAGNTAGSTFAYIDNGATGGQVNGAGRQAAGEVIDDPDERAPTGCGGSKFGGCLRSTFSHVLVMVDTKAVQGASLGLISDYVSMVAMAQPLSLDSCHALTSVIDIYASGCAGRDRPDGLTRADVSYLTSLYKADPEAKRSSQQTDISGRMADMLIKADKDARMAFQRKAEKTGAPKG
jgi:hypothetical protein